MSVFHINHLVSEWSDQLRNLGSSHQQRRDHPASLGHEDVIGPAGRRGVHRLQADPPLQQGLAQGGVGELLGRPTTENHQFRVQFRQLDEVLQQQVGERLGPPILDDPVGQQNQALGITLATNGDLSLGVALYRVLGAALFE